MKHRPVVSGVIRAHNQSLSEHANHSPPPDASPSTSVANGDEAFLPWLREDLVNLCLDEGNLSPEDTELFRECCRLLTTLLHLKLHGDIRKVDDHYAYFDPDRDTIALAESVDLGQHEKEVIHSFRNLALRSNYFEVSSEMITECLDAVTMIDLKTKVELQDFDRVLCFARGDIHSETTVRKLWKTKKVDMDVLQRVVLLLKYKNEDYFKRTGRTRREELQPNKIYTFFYKNVPKYDLEFLFPNVEIGMNLKDKFLLGIPAIGGSIFVVAKLVPKLLIVVGLVIFLVAGPEAAKRAGVSEDSAHQILPAVTALLGLTIMIGGFAVKQWNAVRRKRFEFLKNVSEQLFYRKLANNQAVFHRLSASAESEEAKEAILTLYHLWTGPAEGMTIAELDDFVETWITSGLEAKVDFDINGPVSYLKELALLKTDDEGRLRPRPLAEAVDMLKTLVTEQALAG